MLNQFSAVPICAPLGLMDFYSLKLWGILSKLVHSPDRHQAIISANGDLA